MIHETNHSATYCPEDNKIRFYPDWDDPAFDKEQLKAAGFRWASKQDCYVCPRWTPTAEDTALAYVDDIGDEDYSPQERAADRAERFSGYRDNRRRDADGHATAFEAGPAVFGCQSEKRAQRAAQGLESQRGKALSQWSKAEYWQSRTAGVISNALHRSKPSVRRGRILKLESEERKKAKSIKEAHDTWEAWTRVSTMDGADVLLPLGADGYPDTSAMNAAQKLAYMLANTHRGGSFWHPTCEAANQKNREIHTTYDVKFSAYDLLSKAEYHGCDWERLTPRETAELYLSTYTHPKDPSSWSQRWAAHYENRLAYENAMLENEGGKVSEVGIEPGGFIRLGSRGRMGRNCMEHANEGWLQVQRVNKSPATKRVTSVVVWGTTSGYTRESGYKEYATTPALVRVKIQRLGADAYRPPTSDELEAFKAEQAAKKKAAKSSKPKAPKLINPTDDDAQRLQDAWNAQYKRRVDNYNARQGYDAATYKPVEVRRMTQAEYSERSKGDYAHCRTVTVMENGLPDDSRSGRTTARTAPLAFKVRKSYASGHGFTHAADRVIVLTDKPQKPLPAFTSAETETATA